MVAALEMVTRDESHRLVVTCQEVAHHASSHERYDALFASRSVLELAIPWDEYAHEIAAANMASGVTPDLGVDNTSDENENL